MVSGDVVVSSDQCRFQESMWLPGSQVDSREWHGHQECSMASSLGSGMATRDWHSFQGAVWLPKISMWLLRSRVGSRRGSRLLGLMWLPQCEVYREGNGFQVLTFKEWYGFYRVKWLPESGMIPESKIAAREEHLGSGN